MSSSRIGWAFLLNVCFTIIEFIGGWLTNSTAIMADAVHDLGDSLSIGLAWLLSKLSKKHADETFSYGYHRFSLLGALINGAVLVAGSIWVLTASFPRLLAPEMPDAQGMLGLAILGVIVNGYAAYKLSAGETLNERILNWHLIEDVLGWVAVLLLAIVLMFVDLPILDPILSIAFTLFILFNVLKNLRMAIKPFVIGRKAWLFSNTCNGAHASAILYSLVETAKANGLIVHDYISQCLQHIAEQPNNLEPLLPWNVDRG